MSRIDLIKQKLGEPTLIHTTWGVAEKWLLGARVSLINWPENAGTYLCFIPTQQQDSRQLEWRAGDQAAWFRELYPQFDKISLSHSQTISREGFDEWLDKVIAAMALIATKGTL